MNDRPGSYSTKKGIVTEQLMLIFKLIFKRSSACSWHAVPWE